MLIDLKKFNIDDTFLAHTPEETLEEHSHLTDIYFNKIVKAKNLNNIIDRLITLIDKKHSTFIKILFINAVYLHDIGKINPNFQARKMHNDRFDDYQNSTQSSNHSKYSSELYIDYFNKEVKNIKDRRVKLKLQFIIYNFAYQISKHHGKISNFEDFCKDSMIAKSYWRHIDKLDIPFFEFFILNKLLFSLIVSSDYYATAEYMTKIEFEDFGLFSNDKKSELLDIYQKFITKFGFSKGINVLRNELFMETETNLLKNIDKNIFYLEAPTGSGKTITSINLALQILNNNKCINKLFYIFPFNTLVEQTMNVFDDIFKDKLDIEVVNSIAPIDEQNEDMQEDAETRYNKAYINRLFFNKETIVTTHIALFNILFGTSKEDNFPLWQLANSVLILDEIQSYNNHLWWYMVEFFDKYAKDLNLKIIIMSATLPKLDYFLEKKENFVDLLSREKRDYFFRHNLFKNRVKVDYSLLKNKITLKDLVLKFEDVKDNYKKILFEFISKKAAREFFNLMQNKFDNVYELSGDDNKAHRQFVINKTKKDLDIIIVATQVIEAGIDIDMDLGFKDISTIDSEEQFMGRINRSCKKNSINPKVYFFDFDDAEKIYKNDNRLGYDLKQIKYQSILENKDFNSYYKNVLEDIKKDKNRFRTGLMTDYNNFKQDIKNLNYQAISKTMTLINSQTFTLYFPFKIDISRYNGVKEFENLEDKFLTDKKLDGQKVWDEFVKLNDIENFTKMKVEKSKINSLMQFFTFSLFKYFEGQRPYIGDELYGYYFVENYNEFITKDNKFDRARYNELENSNFL